MEAATAPPAPNGARPAVAPPVEAVSALDQIKARARQDLEELLAPLTARRGQLEAELAEVVAQEQEIHRTRHALDDTSVVIDRGKSPPRQGQHNPSQKTLDDVYAIFATAGRDLTSGEASELAQLSRSTTMRCIQILRDNDRIRLIGTRKEEGDTRQGGRGSNAYQVMP